MGVRPMPWGAAGVDEGASRAPLPFVRKKFD